MAADEPIAHAKEASKEAGHEVEQGADRAERAGQQAMSNPLALAFVRLGFAIKGVVYITIGLLAAGIVLRRSDQNPDQHGALLTLDAVPFGRALLALVTLGLFGYALWNFAEALLDADHEGHDPSALLDRIGGAAIGAAYVLLGVAALQLVTATGPGGKSSDATTQDYTARVLALPFGVPLVILGGLVSLALAGYQFYRAARGTFEDHLGLGRLNGFERDAVRAAGTLGYGSLGVVLGLIGLFLIVAAVHHDPHQARGLAGALLALLSQPYGPILLGIVALGLLGFGVYSLIEARYRIIHPS